MFSNEPRDIKLRNNKSERIPARKKFIPLHLDTALFKQKNHDIFRKYQDRFSVLKDCHNNNSLQTEAQSENNE